MWLDLRPERDGVAVEFFPGTPQPWLMSSGKHAVLTLPLPTTTIATTTTTTIATTTTCCLALSAGTISRGVVLGARRESWVVMENQGIPSTWCCCCSGIKGATSHYTPTQPACHKLMSDSVSL